MKKAITIYKERNGYTIPGGDPLGSHLFEGCEAPALAHAVAAMLGEIGRAGEELNFGDDFKKLCEFRHKWDDGWVCSKCGVRKADWVEADIKTTTREESY